MAMHCVAVEPTAEGAAFEELVAEGAGPELMWSWAALTPQCLCCRVFASVAAAEQHADRWRQRLPGALVDKAGPVYDACF